MSKNPRYSLELGGMRNFVELFIERFAAAHSCPPQSLQDAIITLIQRGLRASPEMDQEKESSHQR